MFLWTVCLFVLPCFRYCLVDCVFGSLIVKDWCLKPKFETVGRTSGEQVLTQNTNSWLKNTHQQPPKTLQCLEKSPTHSPPYRVLIRCYPLTGPKQRTKCLLISRALKKHKATQFDVPEKIVATRRPPRQPKKTTILENTHVPQAEKYWDPQNHMNS